MTAESRISAGQLYQELQLAAEEFNRLAGLAHALGLEVVAELLPMTDEATTALRPNLVVKLYGRRR